MHRGMLASLGLHLCAVAGVLAASLQTESPWLWPPPGQPPYRSCFYSVVDAKLLLKGATAAEVAAFVGRDSPVLPAEGSVTVCLRFDGARSLLLVLDDGRVTEARWIEGACPARELRVPRSAAGAGYVGACPGEFRTIDT
jgi:hypothetical protein